MMKNGCNSDERVGNDEEWGEKDDKRDEQCREGVARQRGQQLVRGKEERKGQPYIYMDSNRAFFAIQCLSTKDCAPRPLEEVPQLCAKLQFSIWLRGYHYLFTNFTATYVPTVETFRIVSHFFID